MLRLYPLVLLIQFFCLYHAYTNKSEQKWFWIIIIFPFIGSCFYLHYHFYSRRNLDNLKEGFKSTFVNNYTIDKLEKQLEFSDTYSNKITLADEHLKEGNYNRAIELYESCYTSDYKNELSLNLKLLEVHYLNEDYKKATFYGQVISNDRDFHNSNLMIAYAWAEHRVGNTNEAKNIFAKTNRRYCNYEQRLEYAYFLEETEGLDSASRIIDTLLNEIDSMDTYERRIYKNEIKQIKRFYK